MLQVCRDRCGFHRFIGELTGQDSLQPLAEFFTRQFARGPFEVDAHKFKTIRTGTPKAFYGQHQPRVGMIGNRNHPAVRLYCSDQMCSSGLSSEPRTSQEGLDNGARRPPFSQSSAAPAETNSRRPASSSAANFITPTIREVHNV